MQNKSMILKSLILAVVVVVALVLGLQGFGKAFPDTFSNLQTLADQYGLLGVFLVMFVGGTLFPLPVDAFYIGLVKLAINPWPIIIASIVASFFSGLLNYYIGYFLQDRIFGRFVKKEHLEKTKNLFDKYGPVGIIIFGAIPLSPVEDPISLFCGLVKMNVKKFALYWLVSRVLSFGILTAAALFLNIAF